MAEKHTTDPKIERKIPRLIRGVEHALLSFGARTPRGADPRVFRVRPWYHNFEALGVRTSFDQTNSIGEKILNAARGVLGKGPMTTLGSHLNQELRDQYILPALRQAVDLHRELTGEAPEGFLDTMSADGYYAFYAVRELGLSSAQCVELEPEHYRRGMLMKKVLSEQRIQFLLQNVLDMDGGSVDIALSAGGLYHLTEPKALIRLLRRKAKVAVFHSAVTTATNDVDYFVAPAPGLQHGSRFSRAWLRQACESEGWEVQSEESATYPGAAGEELRKINAEGFSVLVCK